MFQQFYKDTLAGRYIKSLLLQTPIPVFDSVVNGDHITAGMYYVYKRYIIHCQTSGVLVIDESKDMLYPSDTLYPSVFLYPSTGYRIATFYVKCIVDEYNPKTHSTFVSKTNYYDPDTHYQLGRYLRYEFTRTGLNLMPYYNCYNGTVFKDVELSMSSNNSINSTRVMTQRHKVIGVPILFGHTYTIAIDCPTTVMMKAIIYDNSGYVDNSKLPKELVNTLAESGKHYHHMSFHKPVEFRIETDSFSSCMLQKNMYLVIQLPLSNDSSIVVLENFDSTNGVRCNKNSVREYNIMNPSLLSINTHTTFAFSDRLIEYLVGHVINQYDPISLNITTVQTELTRRFSDYKSTFMTRKNKYGLWDNNIKQLLMSISDTYGLAHDIYDQDGNVNKDVFKLLLSTERSS